MKCFKPYLNHEKRHLRNGLRIKLGFLTSHLFFVPYQKKPKETRFQNQAKNTLCLNQTKSNVFFKPQTRFLNPIYTLARCTRQVFSFSNAFPFQRSPSFAKFRYWFQASLKHGFSQSFWNLRGFAFVSPERFKWSHGCKTRLGLKRIFLKLCRKSLQTRRSFDFP